MLMVLMCWRFKLNEVYCQSICNSNSMYEFKMDQICICLWSSTLKWFFMKTNYIFIILAFFWSIFIYYMLNLELVWVFYDFSKFKAFSVFSKIYLIHKSIYGVMLKQGWCQWGSGQWGPSVSERGINPSRVKLIDGLGGPGGPPIIMFRKD